MLASRSSVTDVGNTRTPQFALVLGLDWRRMLVLGVVQLLAGAVAILLIGWPDTAFWAIGLLAGVQLIVIAIMNISLAFACRAHRRIASARDA